MRNPSFGSWPRDDESEERQADWIDTRFDDAPPDPLDAFRQMGPQARANVLAALPDDCIRTLITLLANDGTPRAWAAHRRISLREAVAEFQHAEWVLVQTFAQVSVIGVSHPDQLLLQALATH